VEKNVDVVLVVADPTYESILIAEKVNNFSREMGKRMVWAILNKVQSEEMHAVMQEELNKKGVNIIGTLHFDHELIDAGLMGRPLVQHVVSEDVRLIVEGLEKAVATKMLETMDILQ
jgi:CO dehydrogenase maturation factor